MIKNLYILRESGEFLYAKNFVEQKTLDKQILLGFVMSAIHFSKETFQGIIRKIDLPIGQLVIFRESYTKMLVVAIASQNDATILLESVLGEIFDLFMDTFRGSLPDLTLGKTRTFDLPVRKLIKSKVKSRGALEIFLSILIAFGCSVPLILIGSIVIIALLGYVSDEFTYFFQYGFTQDPILSFIPIIIIILSIQMLYVLLAIPIPSYIAGYFAGKKNNGIFSALAFNGVLIVVYIAIIFAQNPGVVLVGILLLFLTITSLPLILLFGIVFGYFGGMMREKKALFPE